MAAGEKNKKRRTIWVRILLGLALLVVLTAAFSLWWGVRNYSNVSLEQITFLVHVPMKGVSKDLMRDYLATALLPALACYGAIFLLGRLPRRSCLLLWMGGRRVQLLPLRLPSTWLAFFLVCAGILLFFRADENFALVSYVKNQLESSTLIEEEYISPAQTRLTFPAQKKNLICIYVESGESSAQDRANGGLFPVNYIPELTALARENISFSQSEKIEGAAAAPYCGWTMAGLVAQTAGIPLMLPADYQNVMGSRASFLPGVVSLGEILENQGYRNYFLAGSDFAFGGRKSYAQAHGNYQILDYNWALANQRIPKDYHVFWGFEDQKLFSIAREELIRIAAEEEPFSFSLLTVDTHMPNGYLCGLCRQDYPSQYANVWACASRQIAAFVEWIQEQDFYQDTAICICGDHLSMNTTFYGGQSEDDYLGQVKRKVYNVFIHPFAQPEKVHNRAFTTMDMFPTVLASLGVEIEGNRLGLGTNLFSGEKTLAEKYGYPHLFEELSKRSRFYEEELLYG